MISILKTVFLFRTREYAKRRVKFEFVENKHINEQEKIKLLLKKAETNLESIKRQVMPILFY